MSVAPTLMGLRVVVDDARVPRYREVPPRDRHRGRCYAARVAKKWRRRHGAVAYDDLVPRGTCLRAGSTPAMSTATLQDLKRRLADAPASTAL